VDMHATDLVGINGVTRVLLVYTCQQGVYPRGHVLPLSFPCNNTVFFTVHITGNIVVAVIINPTRATCSDFSSSGI
jgi:hypothetical protein